MDLFEMDLSKYMDSNKIDEKEAISILRQIVEGFGELRKHYIIHSNLKPQNIFRTQEGLFKISDYGFSKLISHLQASKSFDRTLSYMSPEVLKGEKFTSKCDIWSLGVIFYEMLTGQLPYKVEEIDQLELKIPSSISPRSQDILQQMLRKDQD